MRCIGWESLNANVTSKHDSLFHCNWFGVFASQNDFVSTLWNVKEIGIDQFTELGIKQSVLVIPKVHGKPYWVEGGGGLTF